jgi:hypothetical protein
MTIQIRQVLSQAFEIIGTTCIKAAYKIRGDVPSPPLPHPNPPPIEPPGSNVMEAARERISGQSA